MYMYDWFTLPYKRNTTLSINYTLINFFFLKKSILWAIRPPNKTWKINSEAWLVFFLILLSLKSYTFTDPSTPETNTLRKAQISWRWTGVTAYEQVVKARLRSWKSWVGNKGNPVTFWWSTSRDQDLTAGNMQLVKVFRTQTEAPSPEHNNKKSKILSRASDLRQNWDSLKKWRIGLS